MFAFPATLSMSAVRPPMFAGPILRHSSRSNAVSKGVLAVAVAAGVSSGLGEGVAEGSCAEVSTALRTRNRERPRKRLVRNILFLQNFGMIATFRKTFGGSSGYMRSNRADSLALEQKSFRRSWK